MSTPNFTVPGMSESTASEVISTLDQRMAGLLDLARSRSRHRVVVKRPARSGFLGDRKPAFSIAGKSTRFDIYLAATQQSEGR